MLPFIPNEDVVVIDEWRQAVERVDRTLPAGSIEADHDRGETVRREFNEETG